MRNSNFSGSTFEYVEWMSGCSNGKHSRNLNTPIDFTGSNFSNTQFGVLNSKDLILDDVNFSNAHIEEGWIHIRSAKNADFSGIKIGKERNRTRGSDWTALVGNLSYSNLENSKLIAINISGKFEKTNFRKSQLIDINIYSHVTRGNVGKNVEAFFIGSKFDNAKFVNANFASADFHNSSFKRASIIDSFFINSDFNETNLNGLHIKNSDISGAILKPNSAAQIKLEKNDMDRTILSRIIPDHAIH